MNQFQQIAEDIKSLENRVSRISSDLERPYFGKSIISGLTQINPVISISRSSGFTPCAIQVSANDTTADAGDPFRDLDFSWNFGATTEWCRNPAENKPVDLNVDQKGPEAFFIYRKPGLYKITLNVRGWNGSEYIEETATLDVNIQEWAGETKWFDSSAPTGGNGTEASPYSTGLDLTKWLTLFSTNRRAMIKAGSVFDVELQFRGVTGCRIESYGGGAKPVITKGISAFNGYGWDLTDLVISGIKTTQFLAYNSTNGDKTKPYGQIHTITLDNCDFNISTCMMPATDRVHYYKCSFNRDNSGQGLFIALTNWGSVVGCSFVGGNGSLILDHHLYPNVAKHSLYRWISFGPSKSLNFALNTNALDNIPFSECVVVDGCDFSGTQNGMDLSNSKNNPTLGRFDKVVVQNNVFRPDSSVGSQGIGLYSTCLWRVVVRNNIFWGSKMWDINMSDPLTEADIYDNKFYNTVKRNFPSISLKNISYDVL